MRTFAALALSVLATLAASGQAFVNLNFEQANVSGPVDSLGRLPATNALPGWQTDVGTSPTSLVYFNTSDLDQMTVGIYNSLAPVFIPHPVLGQFTAYLEGDLGSITSGVASIAQTGLIPAAAKTIRFATTSTSDLPGLNPSLYLLINGTAAPYYQAQQASGFTTWVADVSSYAGTTSTLKFQMAASYIPSSTHWIFGMGIDNIAFSTEPIPEPSSIALLAFGAVCLAGVRTKFLQNIGRKHSV
jgi:hypothetical protein